MLCTSKNDRKGQILPIGKRSIDIPPNRSLSSAIIGDLHYYCHCLNREDRLVSGDECAKVAILHYIVDRQPFNVMGLIQLLMLLGLGAGAAGFVFNSNRRKRLEAAFYQLLRQQDSCISLIQLVAISQVSSQDAKAFLDAQVRLLNGIPEVDDDGDTFYRFPKLNLPDLPVDDWG